MEKRFTQTTVQRLKAGCTEFMSPRRLRSAVAALCLWGYGTQQAQSALRASAVCAGPALQLLVDLRALGID